MTVEKVYSPSSPEYNLDSLRGQPLKGRFTANIQAPAPVEKQIPHSPEAEAAVIGSLLIDRDAVIKVAPILKAADFFGEERASIYEAVMSLYQQRAPSDLVTLRDELRRRGRLGEGDGQVKSSDLLNLICATATPVHVEYYARIVLRFAIMRRLISAGAQVTALGFDERIETQEMLDKAQELVFGVAQDGVKRDAVKVGSILEEYFDRLAYLHEHRGEIIGVPSGYADLDRLTGGFQNSDLIILAARPAVGKTSLALGFAYNMAMTGNRPVGVFSLEMSREQLVQRMLAMETGVDSQRLRTGYVDESEWDRLTRSFGRLATAPLYIDDSAGITIMELRSKARRLHAEHGIGCLIIDYLQLMIGSRNENRVQEVSEISRNLKALARELNIPIICLSQLSRAVESRTNHVPQLSDLRESGSIEQDADIVMFIYRDELYNPETDKKNIAEIHVAKHRNGPVGTIQLFFHNKTTRFSDLAPMR
ncbi:replicative DNA helicase [Candidatus Chlorohelix sp.]|uniref:replicative DNA helicase n=1 Tax=Candidatus Chlorohelix sp. TaxID=3139201 RepID=UPI00306C8F0C